MNDFEKDLDTDNPNLMTITPTFRGLYYKYHTGYFVIAHFDARRNLKLKGIAEVNNIQLPDYYPITAQNDTFYAKEDFMKFAVNQYVKIGLALMENDERQAKELNRWKDNFEKIIKTIDERIETIKLETKPDYHFSFISKIPNQKFTFEQLADGFASIFSIVAELMLRMHNKAYHGYDLEGLVLLDEPEAHLHLETQKQILPKLTKIFPNVQFIVATHSPHVLNSISNAVIFDMGTQRRLVDVSDIPANKLTDYYFSFSKPYVESIQKKVDEFADLVELYRKNSLSDVQKKRLAELDIELDEVTPYISDNYFNKFKENQKFIYE